MSESTVPRKMSSIHSHRMIANLDDDSPRDELALFDDDDPFNLPPALPPLSPQREDDATNQDGDTAQGDQEAGEGDKKETNQKRKVKRSPRPKLDEVRLCGNRGIPALSHLCDDIKFKGKGHEASDLKLLIQRYEYWAHRLFPKFPFADVVDQVENLGSKKLVQNCIKRIRRGEDDEVEDRSDTELAQNGESQDDGGLTQVPLTPGISNNQAFGVQMEAADRVVILTPEQQERIRLNRERALAKRKAAQERQAQQTNAQTDDQTNLAEESTQSTDDVEVAKEDEDNTENVAEVENDSSLPGNDIEMEDHIVDKNVRSGEDDEQESLEKGSDTNVENVESTSMATDKENVDQEDIEMANAETAPHDSVDIVQEESNVPEESNTNTNKTTEDNELLGSARDLASNEADADLAAAPLMEETSSSSRNDEGLDQEGLQETSDARSTEQAPDENEPVEPQNVEMETEQT